MQHFELQMYAHMNISPLKDLYLGQSYHPFLHDVQYNGPHLFIPVVT